MAASATDAAYVAAGAEIVDRARRASAADLVLKVRSPDADELALMKRGARPGRHAQPVRRATASQRLAAAGLTGFALEAAPRTTRAQSMDVLSIAGQHRRLQGGDAGRRQATSACSPMLMTRRRHDQGRARGDPRRRRRRAAGDRHRQAAGRGDRGQPTCGRAVKEQVESLGAKFIDVPYETAEEKEAAEGVGGYAQADAAELARAADGRGRQARGAGRHRHHHRADPRPRRAGADHRGDGQER
ncbi:MAG: hypothetical protein MZW92_14630 [Comamonadaceae bacterium]|nr:hypothetical protein [Comamonadaceae bacterium]